MCGGLVAGNTQKNNLSLPENVLLKDYIALPHSFCLGICSIGQLSLLGVHRLLIVHFAASPKVNSPATCALIIAASWVFAGAVVIVPAALGWAKFSTEALGIRSGYCLDIDVISKRMTFAQSLEYVEREFRIRRNSN